MFEIQSHRTVEHYILLDALRFVLACVVVLYHYFFLSATYAFSLQVHTPIQYLYLGGYLGVHVFFVVSGFVILHTAQHKSAAQFIKARIARLLPGFMIVSTIGFAFALVFPHTPFVNDLGVKDFFFNFTGLTIFPRFNSILHINFIDDAMWSLRYEAGFYIMVTGILLLKKIQYINIFAYLWIIVSIARNELTIPVLRDIPVNLISADYAPFFVMGILWYLILKKVETNIFFQRLNGVFLVVSFLLSIRFVYTQAFAFSAIGIHPHFPVFAVYYFLLLLSLFFISVSYTTTISSLTLVRIISILGGTSFILYLMHQVIGYRIMYAIGNWNHVETIVLFVGMIYAAVFLHIYLERPLMKSIQRVIS